MQVLLYSTKPASLYEIARQANVSPSQVHKYVAIWKKYGWIKGMQVANTPLIQAFRLMENIHLLKDGRMVAQIRKMLQSVKGIGLYGSWAKGTNNENADVDVWIFVEQEPDDLVLGKIRRALEKKLGKKLDITIVTKEKLRDLQKNNPNFYYSLYHSIRLWRDAVW